jgi:hypothetical protein
VFNLKLKIPKKKTKVFPQSGNLTPTAMFFIPATFKMVSGFKVTFASSGDVVKEVVVENGSALIAFFSERTEVNNNTKKKQTKNFIGLSKIIQ